jgi:hypothetical protein
MTTLNCTLHTYDIEFKLSIIIPWVISFISIIWNYVQLKKIEKFKLELQKKLNVHKIQFEKEFEIYKEISYQLNILRDKISALRPIADRHDSNLTYEQVISKRLSEAVFEGNKLIDITEANRPFYSEDIYQQLKTINALIKKEIIDVSFEEKTSEYWAEGKQTVVSYIALVEKMNDSIRRRIGNMNEI